MEVQIRQKHVILKVCSFQILSLIMHNLEFHLQFQITLFQHIKDTPIPKIRLYHS